MNVSLLIIGDELISGDVADINSVYLARMLGKKGVIVKRIHVVGDGSIDEALKELMKVSDVIFTTGGLGPTHDDVTLEKIAAVLEVPLVHSDIVEKHMEEKGFIRSQIDRKEFLIPSGAAPILNQIGSAPGMEIDAKGVKIVSFPGVPSEMRAMCEGVIDRIFSEQKEGEYSRSICFCHATEDMIAEKLKDLEKRNPGIFIGVYPGRSLVRVSVKGKASSKAAFIASTDELVGEVIDLFPTRFYSSPSGLIEEALQEQMIRKKKTLALAESCTGGLMAHRLSAIAGASHYFLGSVVAYSNEAKEKILGVSRVTLETHGAVSEKTAIEMVEGLFRVTRADYAISVTGIAGPDGGTEKKPVGTVWVCVAERGKEPHARLIQPPKVIYPRDVIIERTTNFTLGILWRKVSYGLEHDY